MGPKRVVHMSTVHSAFDTRIFLKECRSLVEHGYSVTLIVPHDCDTAVDGVAISALPRPKGRLDRMTRVLWLCLKRALNTRAKVYHFHDPELIPVGLVLRLLGRRVIYDVHEDLPRQVLSKPWIPRVLRGLTSRLVAGVEWMGASMFNGIVAATPSIARRFPLKKTFLVQNFPIEGELLVGAPKPYAERPMNVTYVGGVTALRGIREMVTAVKSLPERLQARLLVVGEFDSEALRAEVAAMTLGHPNVQLLGRKTRTEVAEILDESRVGLVLLLPAPNYLASYPTKLFEYMSAGVPIVASDFPVWREIVGDIGCAFLVDPTDRSATAEAIQWLLDHPKEAEVMGRRGQSAVWARLNWTQQANALAELYREMVM